MRSFLLLLPLLLSACGTASHETHSLSPAAFAARLHEPGVQLIDVRSPGEFNGGHLANATNLDQNAGQVQASSGKLDKSKPVLLYCASGRRSAAAWEFLTEQGFKDVVDLQGGIHAWTAAGKPLGDR
jgi:rhodanese-related sulfurtransferase